MDMVNMVAARRFRRASSISLSSCIAATDGAASSSVALVTITITQASANSFALSGSSASSVATMSAVNAAGQNLAQCATPLTSTVINVTDAPAPPAPPPEPRLTASGLNVWDYVNVTNPATAARNKLLRDGAATATAAVIATITATVAASVAGAASAAAGAAAGAAAAGGMGVGIGAAVTAMSGVQRFAMYTRLGAAGLNPTNRNGKDPTLWMRGSLGMYSRPSASGNSSAAGRRRLQAAGSSPSSSQKPAEWMTAEEELREELMAHLLDQLISSMAILVFVGAPHLALLLFWKYGFNRAYYRWAAKVSSEARRDAAEAAAATGTPTPQVVERDCVAKESKVAQEGGGEPRPRTAGEVSVSSSGASNADAVETWTGIEEEAGQSAVMISDLAVPGVPSPRSSLPSSSTVPDPHAPASAGDAEASSTLGTAAPPPSAESSMDVRDRVQQQDDASSASSEEEQHHRLGSPLWHAVWCAAPRRVCGCSRSSATDACLACRRRVRPCLIWCFLNEEMRLETYALEQAMKRGRVAPETAGVKPKGRRKKKPPKFKSLPAALYWPNPEVALLIMLSPGLVEACTGIIGLWSTGTPLDGLQAILTIGSALFVSYFYAWQAMLVVRFYRKFVADCWAESDEVTERSEIDDPFLACLARLHLVRPRPRCKGAHGAQGCQHEPLLRATT